MYIILLDIKREKIFDIYILIYLITYLFCILNCLIKEGEKHIIFNHIILQESDTSFDTQFLLSNHLYLKASVPPTDKVCLWLGANVMLEYNLTDATALVQKNIESAKKNLSYIEHDLDFLRDQFTTTEVNMARVYNWDVKRRSLLKQNNIDSAVD